MMPTKLYKYTSKRSVFYNVLVFAVTLGLTACSGGGGGSQQSPANSSSMAKTSVIATGDIDCPNGGILVESGIDDNANSILDASEVDSSEKVCNGTSGVNSLITITAEAAGVNCSDGGKRIDSGLDLNSNGLLDSGEITQTGYVCNGVGGGIGWKTAAVIETDNRGTADNPSIAIASNNDVVAVWEQSDGLLLHAWSNRYTPATGWGTAGPIDTSTTENSFLPVVAEDNNGNAMAIWTQSDGINPANLWSNYYTTGVGWGAPELVETNNSGEAAGHSVVIDTSGNAVAIWAQSDGSVYNIWSNRYVPGSGWGTPELIELNSGDALPPKAAIDSSGNIITVWEQFNGSTFDIWSNRYVAGSGWGTAALLEPVNTGSYDIGLQIIMDSGGDAAVIWSLTEGSTRNIGTSRYTFGSGWGTAVYIDQTHAANAATAPQIAINSTGNAVAVWQQTGTPTKIWANRYVVGSGWSTAELIEPDGDLSGPSARPQVAIDTNGNVEAVWEKNDGVRNNIWANRYVPGPGWGNPELIETDNSGDASLPQVVLNSAGNTTAVWKQTDGTNYSIWANYRRSQ